MQVWVLGSGSRGNAVVIESGGARILVDAGFQPHDLRARLHAVGVAPESIESVVVTHEHGDHVRGAAASASRFGWTVYATAGTIAAAPSLREAGATPIRAGDTVGIGGFGVTPVRASHDAAEPAVLVVTATASGARCGVAYDLGCVTAPVASALADLDLLLLEANHDELMLAHGPYPPSVRERISGRRGHLSNRVAGLTARGLVHRGLRHIVLAHLSETCNDPRTALRDVGTPLRATRFAGRLSVAPQERSVGPFAAGRRAAAAVQLDLGL